MKKLMLTETGMRAATMSMGEAQKFLSTQEIMILKMLENTIKWINEKPHPLKTLIEKGFVKVS